MHLKDKINYNETHPDSIFVQNLLITQPKSYGRVTMSQQHLTVTKQNKKYNTTSHLKIIVSCYKIILILM